MKVTCISCHKKFDNDKYYGICPKCGAFNKLHFGVDEHERYHQMYDEDKDVHSERTSHEQFHKQYDNTTSHAKVSTAGMEGSSLYAEELNKKKIKNTQVNSSMPVNRTEKENKASGVKFVRWIIIFVVLANVLPFIFEFLIEFFG